MKMRPVLIYEMRSLGAAGERVGASRLSVAPYPDMSRKRRRARSGDRLWRLAAKQHGVVSRKQMRFVGTTDDVIDHAVAVGRLHRVFRNAYAVGHPPVNENSRLMAAVLACGQGAVISHRSAGALLGLLDEGPVVIDVIAPPSRGRKIDGIYLHRVRAPRLEETGRMHGVPCTSPARTLVDLAGTVGEWTLRSAFERAARKECLDLTAIEASIDPRRRGMKVLLKLIDEWRGAAPLLTKRGKLKSPLEAKVLPLLVQRNLPPPLFSAPVQLVNDRGHHGDEVTARASRSTSSGRTTASSSRPTAATSTASLSPSSEIAGATAN